MPLAIVATAETSPGGIPRVKLVVTGGTGLDVTIYRVDPSTTAPIRQANPAQLIEGGTTVYDYESEFGVAVTYRAVDSAGEATSAPVTITSSQVWLIHPGQPEKSIPLQVMEWPNWQRPIEQEAFQPIARSARVVVSSLRGSPEGEMTTYTEGAAARRAFLDITDTGTPLLFKGTAVENAGQFWASIGELGEDPVEIDLTEFSVWSLPLVVVDAPGGRALPPITYAETSAAFFTYAQAAQLAPTYADRASGSWL